MRKPWGKPAATPLAADPDSARAQWSEEQFRLSKVPLEATASAMEGEELWVLQPFAFSSVQGDVSVWIVAETVGTGQIYKVGGGGGG
jgi:hypothetical protein